MRLQQPASVGAQPWPTPSAACRSPQPARCSSRVPAVHPGTVARSGSPAAAAARVPARPSVARRAQRQLAARAAAAEEQETAGSSPEATVGEFCVRHQVPLGQVLIRPVQQHDVSPASFLLTRAFATSLQGVPLQDGRSYVEAALRQPPDGTLLVARLTPTDPSLLPPGQDARLIATTGLSFCRATRENFPSLQPPDDEAYLANMAVDVKLRRQGTARLMLAAAEALAAARGFSAVWLHVRLADEAARALYLSSGYEIVQKDTAMARLRGITPRALCRKAIAPPLPS